MQNRLLIVLFFAFLTIINSLHFNKEILNAIVVIYAIICIRAAINRIKKNKKIKNEWLCSIEKKNVYLKKNVHLVKLKIFN